MWSGPFGAGTGVASLDLPPMLSEIALRESGDAFAHASTVAAEAGAGTIVWVRRFDVAEFAVVMEPEAPLAEARRAFYLGMLATADALSAVVPPEKPLAFDWPDTIRLDGAVIGGGRLGWPAGARETEVPDWLVFGAVIRGAVHGDSAGGAFSLGSSLEVEGAEEVEPRRIVESFARHLMVRVDAFAEKGFTALGAEWLGYLPAEAGATRGIDGNGDLLVRREGARTAERLPLVPRLAAPAWRDPATGLPWL
jgi:biotin-(acetyl-CoA carboxylase) ligase